MRRLGIGIDVGGTFIKAAVVTREGRLQREQRLPTLALEGPASLVARISELLRSWKGADLRAAPLGLGLAGDVDSVSGRLRFTPNLPGWDKFDFKGALRQALKRSVLVENDANCAVWGAYVTELKRKPLHVVGVTLGTGVGGGLVLNGRLYSGATGSAGEIGHTVVVDRGERCHCGARGCLEAYAGNYGIVRTARKFLRSDPEGGRVLRALCPDLSLLTPEHLTRAAERGDAVAAKVWDRTGSLVGVGLANLVLVLNPDVLLLLGGVSRAGHWLLDPIRRVLDAQAFRTPFGHAAVRMAVNHNGGCVGAALLALEHAPRR